MQMRGFMKQKFRLTQTRDEQFEKELKIFSSPVKRATSLPQFDSALAPLELLKRDKQKFMKIFDEDGVVTYVIKASYLNKLKALEFMAVNKRKSLIHKQIKCNF